jgi:hypothetical protein
MTWRKAALAFLIVLMVAVALLWLARARIAAQFATAYFRSHGVVSAVEIGNLGLSGVSGRFSLGPSDAPDISADRIELHFDPLSWIPRVVEVRLVNPVIRARLDDKGTVTLPSLQGWINSLQQQQGKSSFVSDDLAVSLTGLRALLATPAGALEVGGDVKLVKNLPVLAQLKARPAALAWQGVSVRMDAASLSYDSSARRAQVHFAGALKGNGINLEKLDAGAATSGLTWTLGKAAAAHADTLDVTLTASTPGAATSGQMKAVLRNVAVSSDDTVTSSADLQMTATAHVGPDLAKLPPLGDAALSRLLAASLSHLKLDMAGRLTRRFGKARFHLTAPLKLAGAQSAQLSLPTLTIAQVDGGATVEAQAVLGGSGLPHLDLATRTLFLSPKGFAGNFDVGARFSYRMLHDAQVRASVLASWRDGGLRLQSSGCSRFLLAAFHTTSDLARSLRGSICPAAQPLLVFDAKGWSFNAKARDAVATLPLANARLDNAAATLHFEGHGSAVRGNIALASARATDLTPVQRFQPLLGSGTITLKDWIWRGRILVADTQKNALGETSFTHAVASGTGTAHVSAPNLVFSPGKLQPANISILLAALRRAEGRARFEGDIGWTPRQITSSGTLSIDSLDFMTPLGKAHAVKTDIHFQSLLPPITAPDQQITISRIDWTLPFSAVDLRFAVGDGAVKVRSLDLDIAEGHAALGALTIDLANPGNIAGAVQFKSIALNSLIAASNLGTKVKMEGKISGSVPFTLTSEGFRIRDGHVTADGTGRLSFDRSMWAQAGPAANAVQDFAYQAMEYLAFDTLSADLNSVPKGRLQVVFKIKGKSDPPKPQTADVAISDILDGTALQKPIPLPSGTPIDLTLDTSLNFDELLKSYAEAWSNSLDLGAGAKP